MRAMPDPRKVVERSADICRQQGMSDVEAYQFIAATAQHVISYLEVRGFRDLGWLRRIEQVATARAATTALGHR